MSNSNETIQIDNMIVNTNEISKNINFNSIIIYLFQRKNEIRFKMSMFCLKYLKVKLVNSIGKRLKF